MESLVLGAGLRGSASCFCARRGTSKLGVRSVGYPGLSQAGLTGLCMPFDSVASPGFQTDFTSPIRGLTSHSLRPDDAFLTEHGVAGQFRKCKDSVSHTGKANVVATITPNHVVNHQLPIDKTGA
jgi:hypothetical protein